jgi:hypothetical protein
VTRPPGGDEHDLIVDCRHCGRWFYVCVADPEGFEARCGYCDVAVFAPRCEELGHSFEECGFKGGMVVKDLVGKIISPGDPTMQMVTPEDTEQWQWWGKRP